MKVARPASPPRPRGAFPPGFPRSLALRRDQSLYRRVYEALRGAIAGGLWPPGAELPSEAAIGARFAVSRITVRQALQLLQVEGYIATRRARRAVVLSPDPFGPASGRLDSIDDLIAAARDAELRVLSWRSELAPEAAGILGVPPGTDLRCLRSVLARARRPYARSAIYFHPTVGGRLRRRDFDDVIVFRVMQRQLGIHLLDVKMTAWAEIATQEDVAQLRIRTGSAMLCTQLVYRGDQGLPLEVALTRYPAEAFRLTYTLTVRGREA